MHYLLFKIIHIIGAGCLLGIGFALLYKNLLFKVTVATTSAISYRHYHSLWFLAWVIITPLALFQFISALFIIINKPALYTSWWLISVFAGMSVAGLCWFSALSWLRGCLQLAEQPITELSLVQLQKADRYQIVLAIIAFALILSILFLMTSINHL